MKHLFKNIFIFALMALFFNSSYAIDIQSIWPDKKNVMQAARRGDIDKLQRLINAGANLDLKDRQGGIALVDIAKIRKHTDIVNILTQAQYLQNQSN